MTIPLFIFGIFLLISGVFVYAFHTLAKATQENTDRIFEYVKSTSQAQRDTTTTMQDVFSKMVEKQSESQADMANMIHNAIMTISNMYGVTTERLITGILSKSIEDYNAFLSVRDDHERTLKEIEDYQREQVEKGRIKINEKISIPKSTIKSKVENEKTPEELSQDLIDIVNE